MPPKKQKLLPHHPLSPPEVLKIANSNGHVCKYMSYDKIRRLPAPGKAYIILIRAEQTYGHYIAIINHGDTIEWFDSYASKPDRPILWQSDSKNAELGQDVHIVSNLMRAFANAGGKLEYNECKFQNERNKSDESCGYQCGVRVSMCKLTLPQYQRWLKDMSNANGMSTSNVVIALGEEELSR